ncbi:hypothetical protein F3Y22_tig00110549pilonHSYRG00117 [Hibiscus syriacus]|uniref:phospholipase D n=1 Tax=Hibiscus syriacus TaxID=106335 RepID=A0A6A3ADV7_HIBSY|nr:hypothetical protein F3Y22_tig00110549pilonHSYRG00117 [Hibiscus syriacus]
MKESETIKEYSDRLLGMFRFFVQLIRILLKASLRILKKPQARIWCAVKNVLIDMSIHTAYVKAIRTAQHFIYIENQYFIGSSFNWSSNKDLANNFIPMELALKIASKIAAHERFTAYIVVPMFPEGVPTGSATQRILFWQHKTMQMMYETIHRALVEAGPENAFAPLDFLNFFCLGNRKVNEFQSIAPHNTSATTPQGLSRKNQRFMIYVHSKGMIVDDEYVIIGSANINHSSMEGTRLPGTPRSQWEVINLNILGQKNFPVHMDRKSLSATSHRLKYKLSLVGHGNTNSDVYHQTLCCAP